jgi:hypothetical protein
MIVADSVRVIKNLNLSTGEKADGLQFDDKHGEIIQINELLPILRSSVLPIFREFGQEYRIHEDMPDLEMITIERVS